MPGDPDPLSLVTGLTTAVDVSKPQTVAYLKADLHCFTTAAAVRSLDLSGRTRIMIASRFFRKETTSTSLDDGTETSLVVIDGAGNHWAVIEGERYDLPYSSSGLLGDGEELPAIGIVTPLILPAGLPGSVIFCDVAPTAQAIFTFKKKTGAGAWTTVFTATIAAGATQGTFTLAADATLAAEDRLRPVGPTPHDSTLEGFIATIAAIR